MKMPKLFFAWLCGLLLFFSALQAQIPNHYYDAALHTVRYDLKTALHGIIKSAHSEQSYGALWTHFSTTDRTADGKVWDMYSNCTFTFSTNQCGNYSKECDCYNREHSFPKSWFSDATPMYTDLFHLYPTDGYVNGKRGNYPFGEVGTATYTSANGSKVGNSSFSGYTGLVFEPIDEYKGDFARTYFYMVTRYEDKVSTFNSEMLDKSSQQAFSTWAKNLLLKWHRADPVSDKEIHRNNEVFKIQKNRNPFIDYPMLAEKIWGDDDSPFTGSDEPGIAVNTLRLFYVIEKENGDVVGVDTLYVGTLADATPPLSVFGLPNPSASEVVILEANFDGLTPWEPATAPEIKYPDHASKLPLFSSWSKIYEAGDAIKIGSGNAIGSLTTKGFDASQNGGSLQVDVRVKGYSSNTGTLEVSFADGSGKQSKAYTAKQDGDYETLTFTLQASKLRDSLLIASTTASKRCFIDHIKVYSTGGGSSSFVSFSEISLDFGRVGRDSTARDSVVLTASDLTGAIHLSSGASLTVSPSTVSTDGSHKIYLSYRPDSLGYFCDTLRAQGSDLSSPLLLPCSGEVVANELADGPYIRIEKPTKDESFSESRIELLFSVEAIVLKNGDTRKEIASEIRGLSNGVYRLKVGLMDTLSVLSSGSGERSFRVSIPEIVATEVANLRALRQQKVDTTIYKVRGEVFYTAKTSNRNQKWVQDSTGGILVDDPSGIITSTYTEGDGLLDITGSLATFGEQLQLMPKQDFGVPHSSGLELVPLEVTLAQLQASLAAGTYEGRLVRLNGVKFTTTGTFGSNVDHTLSQGTESINFRTFIRDADYVGEAIPTQVIDVVALVGRYNNQVQICSRSQEDFIVNTGLAGPKKPSAPQWTVYPNPSQGLLKVRSQEKLSLRVYHLSGQHLQTFVVDHEGEIDLRRFGKGTYLLHALGESVNSVQTVIVQ